MEKVAWLQFMASRDAKDNALLYIALECHTILAGLFKIIKDEHDRSLVDFMTRDFQVSYMPDMSIKDANVVLYMFVRWTCSMCFYKGSITLAQDYYFFRMMFEILQFTFVLNSRRSYNFYLL